jgi:hypothetical protein
MEGSSCGLIADCSQAVAWRRGVKSLELSGKRTGVPIGTQLRHLWNTRRKIYHLSHLTQLFLERDCKNQLILGLTDDLFQLFKFMFLQKYSFGL